MTARLRPVPVSQIGSAAREFVLAPDAAARQALAERLGLPAIIELHCRMELAAGQGGRVSARGVLTARVVQEDVTTLADFESPVQSAFRWLFVPEERLSDRLDPDDPVDEIGYADGVLDLEEAVAQQLALVLEPYPRKPDQNP